MLGYLKLRIQSQYRTQGDFARACGKSEAWLSRIIQGRRESTKEDKELIVTRLKPEPEHPEVLFINTTQDSEQ